MDMDILNTLLRLHGPEACLWTLLPAQCGAHHTRAQTVIYPFGATVFFTRVSLHEEEGIRAVEASRHT